MGCLCLSCSAGTECIWRTKLLTRARDYGLQIGSTNLLACEHYEEEVDEKDAA